MKDQTTTHEDNSCSPIAEAVANGSHAMMKTGQKSFFCFAHEKDMEVTSPGGHHLLINSGVLA